VREPATLLAAGRCTAAQARGPLAGLAQQMVKPESLWHGACWGGVAERLVLVDSLWHLRYDKPRVPRGIMEGRGAGVLAHGALWEAVCLHTSN